MTKTALLPRAARFLSRLKGLPVSAWPRTVARAALDKLGRATSHAPLPENLRFHRADAANLAKDVAYALSIAGGYLQHLARWNVDPNRASLLELGPGRNFGVMLLFAGLGARAAVADRFLTPWDPGYHPQFYRALKDVLPGTAFAASALALDAALDAKGYPEALLGQLRGGAEDLGAAAAGSRDAVFSNAVLEHVRDLDRVLAEVLRITRPGGFGFHQVDFRDHRNFDKPLEYLLLAPEEFSALFDDMFGECGRQTRPEEFRSAVLAAGFEILADEPNMFADPAYLADFIPRLQASSSAYQNKIDLSVISAHYTLRA